MFLDGVDLFWTEEGDLAVAPDGDLLDTSANPLLWLVQAVKTRVEADLGDWRMHPTLGANLSTLIGEPISNSLKATLEDRIISALTGDGLVNKPSLNVSIIEIKPHILMVRISILADQTSKNQNVVISLNYLYDTNEKGPVYLQ